MISVSQNSTLLGLDVHKLTISAAVLAPGADVAVVDKISSDPDAVRRLVARFEDPSSLVACYEAGPTGYELARQLRSLGVRTEVVAPSLIPVAPGNRVKTDKRDARRLALLLRGGQLSAVRVPDVAEEAVRDLCRARADMVIDRTRARHRLGKFLLRHGRVWREGENWTLKHQAWIGAQRFGEPALDATLSHYQATLSAREAAVDAVDAELSTYFDRAPFADACRIRLGLQVPGPGRRGPAPPPRGPRPRGRRPSLGRTAATLRAFQAPRRPQVVAQDRRHRHRPRAGVLRVGRDDGRLR